MESEISFNLVVQAACMKDPRFSPLAYGFLCRTLEHTQQMLGHTEGETRHVSGPEIMAGWRDFAVLEFGPLAGLVMQEWGIRRSEDVGDMVFNLIDLGYFRRSESDKPEDFADGVDLFEALQKPFQSSRV